MEKATCPYISLRIKKQVLNRKLIKSQFTEAPINVTAVERIYSVATSQQNWTSLGLENVFSNCPHPRSLHLSEAAQMYH
jgi:hypothetical protein